MNNYNTNLVGDPRITSVTTIHWPAGDKHLENIENYQKSRLGTSSHPTINIQQSSL